MEHSVSMTKHGPGRPSHATIIEYASTVWDPHTKADMESLVMVHRRAARIVSLNYRRRGSVRGPCFQDLRVTTETTDIHYCNVQQYCTIMSSISIYHCSLNFCKLQCTSKGQINRFHTTLLQNPDMFSTKHEGEEVFILYRYF